MAQAAELEWEAPPTCPNREGLESRVYDTLGLPLAQAGDLRFSCKVTQLRNGKFRLELLVLDGKALGRKAPRVIEADRCDQVVETAAVAIALALGADDSVAVEPSGSATYAPNSSNTDDAARVPGSDAKTVRDVVATNSPKPLPPIKSSAITPPNPVWLTARLGPVVDIGSLPGLAPGVEAAVLLGFGSAAIRLSGFTLMEREAQLTDGSGGRFSLMGGALAACGTSARESAYASFCAGLELGQLKGQGIGVLQSRTGIAAWVTPRVDVTLTSAPTWFGLHYFAGLGAGLPLSRSPFLLGGSVQVHRPASMVGRLAIGLEIDWQ